MNLQYRDRLEFAIGRTCSVDWVVHDGSRRASAVETTWLPVAETPQTRAGEVRDALLSMRALATAPKGEIEAGLMPLVDGYGDWLETQARIAGALPPWLRDTAECCRSASTCSGSG